MPITSALLEMSGPAALAKLGISLPTNHERISIPDGVAGTAATVTRMQDLVAAGKRDFRIRELVGKLVRECSKKDYACYGQACFNYCRDQIQYVYDPTGVELLESPWRLPPEYGGSGIADCDSICILLASMFEAMGFPARFVTIRADKSRPDEFSHVFVETKIPGHGWMGADATMPEEFGWKPEGYPRREWPATKDGGAEGNDPTVMGIGSMGTGLANFIDEGSVMDAGPVDLYEARLYGPPLQMAKPEQYDVIPTMGMDGLGDAALFPSFSMPWSGSADSGVLDILEKVYNGTVQQDLRGKWAEISEQLAKINTMRQQAVSLSEPARSNALNALTSARNFNLDASMKITDAKNKYDAIVDIIGKIPGVSAPSKFTLSGLGFIPPALAAAAVTGTTIAVLLVALGVLISQIGGAINGGDGYIQQAANFMGQLGGAFKAFGDSSFNIGMVVLVGLAGYVGYKYFQKRGTI